MLLVFSALRLVPSIFAFPNSHDVWGGNAYQLAAVAAAWILAEANARRAAKREHDTKQGFPSGLKEGTRHLVIERNFSKSAAK
jgi:hypothetical protein